LLFPFHFSVFKIPKRTKEKSILVISHCNCCGKRIKRKHTHYRQTYGKLNRDYLLSSLMSLLVSDSQFSQITLKFY